MQRVAIVGGTRGIGRAIARVYAERGDAVCILGRSPEQLSRSVADLQVRGTASQTTVVSVQCDLENTSKFSTALDEAERQLGGLDVVVLTAAQFATQEKLEADSTLTHALLNLNFTQTILFCEAARKKLLAKAGGTLCVLSSVAGDRARKPVVLYGAAKAGLSYYLEGLDHRFRDAGLRVICVKPGFVKTAMTAGLKVPPFAGEPDAVAQRIVKAADAGTPVVYAPAAWWLVMAVIRRLPRWVMRRIRF